MPSTYVLQLLVLFAEIVVQVQQLLVSQFLLQIPIRGSLHPVSLCAVLEVKPAHLNSSIYIRITQTTKTTIENTPTTKKATM